MAIFSNPNSLKDLKTYVPLLKKALLTVKPEAKRKFLYYKQFPMGAHKVPLILVDFDSKIQEALNKNGEKPAAEGVVSLTQRDELNFEAMKGSMKRGAIRKHFATLGSGIKPVFVPEGETDDDESTLAMPQLPKAPTPGSPQPKKETFEEQLAAKAALASGTSQGNAAKSGGTPPARPMLTTPPAPVPSTAAKPPASVTQLKWDLWFQAIPLWPQGLTQAEWNKSKGTMAKLALSTGIGDQLRACEAAYQAAVAKMPLITNDSRDLLKVAKECQEFSSGSEMTALRSSLKKLQDVAEKAGNDCRKNKVISKDTEKLCDGIAQVAGELGNACNLNKCLENAIKNGKALILLGSMKDVEMRITHCEELLKANPGNSMLSQKVEDILAKALKERDVARAKEAYAKQAKGDGGKFDLKNLMEKEKVLRDEFFESEEVVSFMKSTGLTKGEAIAIRAYTANNYAYINPAIANQKDRKDKKSDWMDKNRPEHPDNIKNPKMKEAQAVKYNTYETGSADEAGSKKGLYEEGALHAGMLIEAFKKLPPKKAKLYRGARMTAKGFRSEYAAGKIVTYEAFASQTTSEDVARQFANGAGQNKPKPEETTSVFVEAFITNGRDVMALSATKAENELLVPPGTKLRVDRIEDDPVKEPGSGWAPAKEWKRVTLIQVT